MATGDKAFAKGLRVVPEAEDFKQGFDAINERGDELADEIDARSEGDSDLAAAVALKLDASKILVQATAPANIAGTGYSGRIWIKKA